MGFSSFKSYGYQVAIPKIITAFVEPIVINRPIPFIWLKFDAGDITNTTTLKNYGSQGTDATLQKAGTGSYPQILTTGQSVGTGCISLIGNDTTNGGFIQIAPLTIPTTGLTFALWFKRYPNATLGIAPRLFDFGNGTNIDNILAYFIAHPDMAVYISTFGEFNESYGSAFNTGEWFHFAFTLSTDGRWSIYINGTLSSTIIKGYPAQKTLTLNYIGKSNWSQDSYITIQMDDFRFYNVPLSSDDVLALYNKTYDQ